MTRGNQCRFARWLATLLLAVVLASLYGPYGVHAQTSYAPGEGAPDELIHQAFIAAAGRHSANILELTSIVHTWGQETASGSEALVQNFRESASWNPDGDDDTSSIIYNPTLRHAFVFHGHIEDLYANADGPLGAWVGYPTSDEETIDSPAFYDFEQGGAIGHFERGFIAWPRGADGFQMHTYYPTVAQPQFQATPIGVDQARLQITVPFERAPGYPDTDDPLVVTLVWSLDGVERRTQMDVLNLHTARASIDLPRTATIGVAIEVDNRSHNTSKRGSFPIAFASGQHAMQQVGLIYRLGAPPATNGNYWNAYDDLFFAEAARYNLPPALLKAVAAHESGNGLGAHNGKDPTAAYLYEPNVDASIQYLLEAEWAKPWLLPNNPPPADLLPCRVKVPGGYILPAGTTARDMVDTHFWCTNGRNTTGLDLSFVAQYRLAASYGLGQIVYRWHWDRLNPGEAPEALYTPQRSIQVMAAYLSSLRDWKTPELTAASTHIQAWQAVLGGYNGDPVDYPPQVYAWYDGYGAASVQPTLTVEQGTVVTGADLLSERLTDELVAPAAETPAAQQAELRISRLLDLSGDGVLRLVELLRRREADGVMSASLAVHADTQPTSPLLADVPLGQGVFGVGNIRVVQSAAFPTPLLLVELPVGPHSLVTRIFRLAEGGLQELAPDQPLSLIYLGFPSDSGPLVILDDGTLLLPLSGEQPGQRRTVVYTPGDSGFIRGETIVGDAVADTTPPTISAALSPQPNQAGWLREPATLNASASDEGGTLLLFGMLARRDGQVVAQAQIRSAQLPPLVVDQDGITTVVLTVEDAAGNLGSATTSVRLDRQAPRITIGQIGPDLSVALHIDDGLGSGIATTECRRPDSTAWEPCISSLLVVDNGTTVQVCDLAGNCRTQQVQLRGQAADIWHEQARQGALPAVKTLDGQTAGDAGVRSRADRLAVRGGASYTFSLNILASSSGMVTQIGIDWYNSKLHRLAEDRADFAAGAAGVQQASFSAPANAAYARLEVRGIGVGEIWIDDVVLLGSEGQNLASGGDFESGLTPLWRPRRWNNTLLGDVSVGVPPGGGSQALHVSHQPTWRGPDSAQIFSNNSRALYQRRLLGTTAFSVEAGQRYQLEIGVKGHAVSGNVIARLLFFDAQGRWLAGNSSEALSGSFGWQDLGLSAVAPVGAARAEARILLRGSGVLWCDVAQLSLAEQPESLR